MQYLLSAEQWILYIHFIMSTDTRAEVLSSQLIHIVGCETCESRPLHSTNFYIVQLKVHV